MSKHSKNNNARAVFTTYERNRAQGIRQGTEKLRLGHDSMKPFDACSITLEPIANPVADLQGHLYSKNAIYDHVLEQKRLYNVQIKAYNKEQESAKKLEETIAQNNFSKKVADFDQRESGITTKANEVGQKPSTKLSNSTLNSFWIPELAPQAKETALSKPSKVLKSPFGHPIKLKDLVTLNLTLIPGSDDAIQTGRYMCPMCKKNLSNAKGVCCLKPCGHVFCSGCFNSILKKDMMCPLSNIIFNDDDVLNLESEGSAFASRSGDKLMAVTKNPVARYG
jgi:nitric oxide synthase-interacting protein